MVALLLAFQLAIELAFALIAIRTAVEWLRRPDRRHAWLAVALGALAADILVAPLFGPGLEGQIATDFGLVLFVASGYGLVMFRDTFMPLRPATRLSLSVAAGLLAVAGSAAALPGSGSAVLTRQQVAVLGIVFVFWAGCVIDTALCFWLQSRARPAVERARLRALSVGSLGVLVIIVAGTVVGSAGDAVTLLIDLLTLVAAPLLYVAFYPPEWLRRLWRGPEELELRKAMHDLLMYSPDRVTLAQRALGWSRQLVGGDGAFLIDHDGSVLAALGISPTEASRIRLNGPRAVPFTPSHDRGMMPWRDGSLVVVPLDIQPQQGAIVIVSGHITPIFGDEEMVRLQEYATSIAAGLERVKLNERVLGLEKTKSEFLSIASHELRGPMTVIKGYLTMLESGLMGELSAQAQSVLPLLISKSDEVNWMLEQMIEASRLEEGRLALNRRRGDVVELADDAIQGVKMLLVGHEVRLDAPAHPIEAEIDPDRFQIVVRNLLSNAAKYSPNGTEIKVSITRHDSTASIAVSDQGVGIAPENQANLFTRFGRVANTQHVQGTGLGLWLSREIARMHGGDLSVDSEIGRGSTFTFDVPVTAPVTAASI